MKRRRRNQRTPALERRKRERESGTESGTEEETKAEEEKDNREDTKTPKKHKQRCHVHGGAWLTQVRAYLRVNLLPEWMWVGKNRERESGEPGRDREEGTKEETGRLSNGTQGENQSPI
ncbi:hypothetical protein NDU88_004274 [Pleurodeles waltl]|uniref:Uncharacterized protein n=1 Tax=Pleurodeles waltl TaxID=8319 RepID=A0AAV7KXE3_PLEWA|nr:hypothetical protein NDU88_004274 [Pleurodeles waltl]